MKIAQIAPLYEAVPPKLYGGTERVVSYLTEELVRKGHDVTLYATADSRTSAKLVPSAPHGLRLDGNCQDPILWHCLLVERIRLAAPEFDVIHSHIDYLPYTAFRNTYTPTVSTLHGRLDSFGVRELYEEFDNVPTVAISESQRRQLPEAAFIATVYHGLPPDMYRLQRNPGKYLAFLGRLSPEKKVTSAITAAVQAELPLKIAAKCDQKDYDHFVQEVKPLLSQPGVEYVGEIADHEKQEFLGNALALMFLIDWPEPFGLVMIEAMACGTPVIARRRGSVPEIIEDGVTGFIVDDDSEVAEVLAKIESFDRARCRERFEQRFTAERMANDYLKVYRRLQFRQHGLRRVGTR